MKKSHLGVLMVVLAFIGVAGGADYALRDKREARKEAALVTDTAIVIGPPVSHSTGTMVYPILLTRTKIHAWLEADRLKHHIKAGEVLSVKYNEKSLRLTPTRTHHVKYVSH